jgi:hypothetical protein
VHCTAADFVPFPSQESEELRKKTAAEARGLDSLFQEQDAPGFADQFHMAFEHQNASLMAQLERVGVALIDLSIQDWTIDDAKVISQLESLAMQTVEAQVGMARNQAQAQAAKLSAEGWAMAEIAKATGDAAVTQARIDADNQSRLSKARASLDAERLVAQGLGVRAAAEANAITQKAVATASAIRMKSKAVRVLPVPVCWAPPLPLPLPYACPTQLAYVCVWWAESCALCLLFLHAGGGSKAQAAASAGTHAPQ